MGFYFRKSISFGGLRVNFSKSGVGFSAGVKGFRVGTGPRGNYIHMGANGLYYKKTFSNNKKTVNVTPVPNLKTEIKTNYDFVDIESAAVSQMIDSNDADLLNEVNEKNSKFRTWIIWLVFSIILSIFVNVALISLLLITPLFFYIDKRRKTVVLIYDIEHDEEEKLQKFYDSFNEIINAKKKWHIPSSANLNTIYDVKVNGGAGSVVRRNGIILSFSTPPYIKTNVKIPKIPVGKQILYFFPERVMVFERKKVGSVNYKNLKMTTNNIQFIEEGIVPSDTKIIGHTWKYVNKNGGPDRRFSNNKQLPIVEYTQMNFTSDTGLNEVIQISKPSVGINLINSLEIVK